MPNKYSVTLSLLIMAAPAWAITLGGGGDARPLDLAQTFDPAADPAVASATYVATQAEGKLKGIKRVAITNMCVQFVNAKSATGQAGGVTRAYTRSAEGGIPGGLDPAKMQSVADGLLDQLEADLRAAGIEVVPYEELAANDLFRKYAAAYESGIREATRSVPAAKGGKAEESVVFVSPRQRPFSPDCGTVSPASTGTFVRMSYPLNAEFLTVSAVVDMGQAKAGGGFLGRASADIDYAEFLRAGDSQYQFVGKTGPGARIWLKQSIVPVQNPFVLGDSVQGERTGSRDELTGTTTMESSSSREMSFDEDLYYRNAAESLAAMHRMFMQKLSVR